LAVLGCANNWWASSRSCLEGTSVKISKVAWAFICPFFGSFCMLLYEFGFASFEFFLARNAAKMVRFAFIRDFVFSRVFI
jgi:hypothetical protein